MTPAAASPDQRARGSRGDRAAELGLHADGPYLLFDERNAVSVAGLVGGLVAARALHALRAAEHADETAMVMSLVLEQLSNAGGTIRGTAAALLTEYYFLARQWDAIADLLDSDSETVRRGALGTLDDLMEAADHTDNDLTPLVPSLLRVFARKGSDYKKTRSPRRASSSGSSYSRQDVRDLLRLNGVDLMGIAEVRAELRSLKRRPSIVTADQKRKAHKAIIDRHVRAIFGRDYRTKRTRRSSVRFRAPHISRQVRFIRSHCHRSAKTGSSA